MTRGSDRFSRRRFVATASLGLSSLAVVPAAGSRLSYPEIVLKARPAGYWRLGERHGPDAADASGNGRPGRFHGNPKFRERGALAGDADTAIGFAPPDTYVEIASAARFSQPDSGFGLTVECWMRPDVLEFSGESSEHYVMVLGKGEPEEMEWGFRFYSQTASRPNRFSAYVWNAEGGLGAGAYFQDVCRPGEWLHVAAAFDAGNENAPRAGVSIYKNGELRGGPGSQNGALYSTYNVRPRKGPAPLRLGTRDRTSFFTGALDEVAIYPRKLTPAELRCHYRSGAGAA